MPDWPNQDEVKRFYGNPQSPTGGASRRWESDNLVFVPSPFPLCAAWDIGQPIKKIRIHRLCSQSLVRILTEIWKQSGERYPVIKDWGMHLFGGAYNFRVMRGGSALSMHSYGCAVDFDPARNGFGNRNPHLAKCPAVLEAFKHEGWVWGGTWLKPDGMHFQAAIPK